MAKEITLSDLVNGSGKNNTSSRSETINTVENMPKASNVVQTSSIKTARPISIDTLGKNLEAQHPEAKKTVITEDSPIVANAFASMTNRLEESKRFIQEEMMPVVIENAKEIALEREIEEMSTKEEETKVPELKDIDDLEDDDEEDVEYVMPEYNNYQSESNIVEEEEEVVPEIATVEVIEEVKEVQKETIVKVEDEEDVNDMSTLDDMMKDLEAFDEDDDQGIVEVKKETTEEVRERYKASLSHIKITRNPIDLSKFQISKNPVSSSMILKNSISNKKRCDFPLLHTRRNMTFEECTGPELDVLVKTINNSNGVNGVIATLRFVYNHVIDANKPDFETWCKSIRTEDIESLYFGIYKACYGSTNIVPRTDKKTKNNNGCGKLSLIDTPINDMIKFNNDEDRKLYTKLMNQDSTTPGDKIKNQLIPISDDFVISYSYPTLYSTFIQYATLDPDIAEKYSTQLNTMAYIDGFYRIDYANQQLVPIAVKEYYNNINKTVLGKLKLYTKILKSLSADQYNIMMATLDTMIDNSKVTFINPKTTCPECGNVIPEEPVDSVLNMLFTRAQLVQVKSL